jgi:hypothetical protein
MLAGTAIAVSPGVASAAPGDVVNNPGAWTAALYNYIPSVGTPGPTGYTPGVSGSFILSGTGGPVDATAPPQCNDGKNNDDGQDTNIDFAGSDAECTSATDDNEAQGGFQAQAQINAAGNISSTGSVTGVSVNIPEQWVYSAGNVANVKITNNTPPAGSTLNPNTGEALLKADVKAVIKASILTCTIGSVKLNLSNYGSTPGAPALQPLVGKQLYNQFTGKTTLVDNQFTIPKSSGFLCGQVDSGFGLPAPAGASIAEVSVVLSPTLQQGNFAPTANAGPTQNVASAASVNLAGSGTDGGDGPLPLTYAWTQTAGPAVTLSSTTVANPSFTAPTGPATLTFQLTTNDGLATSAPSSVTINVAAPVATGGTLYDFDGDGSADRSLYRNGGWLVYGQPSVFLGLATDNPVPADYDGNGTTDKAVYRNGAWIVQSQPTVFFGNATDKPVPADYNGDGSADRVIYRNGAWLSNTLPAVYFGNATDIPVPADYNGDGSADRMVYRNGAWLSPTLPAVYFGNATDKPRPADYNGDGSADRMVYRNGGWLSPTLPAVYFGNATDIAVPADYNGDGSADRMIYRNGGWLSNTLPAVYFGNATDIPLPLPAVLR